MKLTVGFTYDAKSDYVLLPSDPPDKYAEFDDDETINEITDALESSGNKIVRIGHGKNLVSRILAGERWDIVFNICEGLKGRCREAQVPAILELYEIPYVGCDPLTMSLTLDKALAKQLIQYHGLLTSNFICIKSLDEISPKNFKLRFPLIVKPSQEGTSKGLSKESLVRNFTQMKKRTEWLLNTYQQPVIIEEFIVGYEFTVAIIGNDPPEVLPPVQIAINGATDLGEEFYTHARVESSDIKYLCPAEIDKTLEKKICDLALASYKVLGCRDLGRIDIRVDYNGNPYFLECNPLPNLGHMDVFPLIAKASGRTYNELICRILESGLRRYNII
ncbi:MAG: D-alanine--D-alanine ligase [Elusimicrobiota bacterium]|nr:D-alanine--D-alanine ligase [Elusimicrobiota bacterium]